MTIAESLYVPVQHRATELGCAMPEGIAILPENFCEATSRLNLSVRAESVTLRNLFEEAGTPLESFFPLGEHAAFGHDNGLAWEASLFVPARVTARDPDAVTGAITRISAYLSDFFKGHPEKRIALTVVAEQAHGGCRKLAYEGSVRDVAMLAERVLEAARR